MPEIRKNAVLFLNQPARAVKSLHEEVFRGEVRVAGQVDSEPPQPGFVARGGDVGYVDFAVFEFGKFFHCQLGRGIRCGAYAQGDKRFQQIQAEGFFIQDVGLEVAHGFGDVGRDQLDLFRDPGQMLHGVQHDARSRVELRRIAAGYDGPVLELDGGPAIDALVPPVLFPGLMGGIVGRPDDIAVMEVQVQVVDQQFHPLHRVL